MAEKETPKGIPGLDVHPVSTRKEEPSFEPVSFPLSDAAKVDAGFLETWKEDKALSALLSEIGATEEMTLSQKSRVETKAFDATFVDELEEGMDAIMKIISNPRTFLKEESELVNAEKAKKVSPVSIQHFASHSQFLRDITPTGEVIPDKLLTIHSETDTAIYENRFVMTLIRRTMGFINTRMDFIKEHGETKDSDELLIHTKVNLGGVDYEVDMKVRASVPSSDAGQSKKNDEILRRLALCRDKCGYFFRSNFMSQMKGAKEVATPVHMTNMLLKHPDYHRAYLLWCFIDAYESLGITYEVKEKRGKFTEEYLDALYRLVGESILTLHTHHTGTSKIVAKLGKKVTPKIIFTIDEISYLDSKFIYDAYPLAKEAISDPFYTLTLEGQEALIEGKKDKLRLQGKAKPVVARKIQHHKDETVASEARARVKKRKEDSRLEEERAKEEAERAEERAKARRKAEEEAAAKDREEEEELYRKEKKRLGGSRGGA